MKFKMHLLMLPLLLAGCGAGHSSALVKADKLTVPAVKQYTKKQLTQAADEMDKHCPTVPMLCQLANDYGVMRDQARAALGVKVDTAR